MRWNHRWIANHCEAVTFQLGRYLSSQGVACSFLCFILLKMSSLKESLTTHTVLSFLGQYRSFEKMPYPVAYERITQVASKRQVQTICDQWRQNQREFASFYLALPAETQIRLLHNFGIYDEQDAYFLQQYQLDPMFGSYAQNKPETALQLGALLTFFRKNAISAQAIPGLLLEKLPAETKQAATAKNWGNYLLSLKKSEVVLPALLAIL